MRDRHHRSWPGTVAALLLLGGGLGAPIAARVEAAPRPARTETEAEKRARARAIFQRAEIQYNLGRFAAALKLYDEAYRVVQLPGFLFNIGQCHRHLGNFEQALFFYRGYLRKVQRPGDRAVTQKLIRLTERLLRERRARARARTTPRRRVVRPRLRRAPGVGPGPGAGPFGGGAGPTDRRARLHERWWFWTAIAAGLAAVVGVSVAAAMYAKRDGEVPQGSLGTIHVRF